MLIFLVVDSEFYVGTYANFWDTRNFRNTHKHIYNMCGMMFNIQTFSQGCGHNQSDYRCVSEGKTSTIVLDSDQ